MSTATDILLDGFERTHERLPGIVDGLTPEQLSWQVRPSANPIGWLVWHLVRVQDSHLADLADRDEVWTSQGFEQRFGLPYAASATGFGQSSDEVAAFALSDPSLLTDYHEAVQAMTVEIVRGLSDADLEQVIDERWDPPVTAAARLLSVVDDLAQHCGQAAYVRGLLD